MRRLLIAIAVSLFAFAANAMTLDEYIASLEKIQSLLAAGQLDAARESARAVNDQEVEGFHADDALLGAIANAKRIDVRIPTRLAATIAELRRIKPGNSDKPDKRLLDEIDKQQRAAKPGLGGELGVDQLTGDHVVRFSNAIDKAFQWLGDKISKFFDWLMRFWPERKNKEGNGGNIRGAVIGVAILIAIVVVVLAWIAIRRSRVAKPEVVESAAPIASERDDDPLSRATNEWERYAAQLAAAGRMREAIRAWYHAVLVSLYGASILHFRKGRTNWEYVATLPPTIPWRRGFIDLTQRFEHEWYGADESTDEALEECQRRARAILESVARSSRGAA
jgi:hypothetical protein